MIDPQPFPQKDALLRRLRFRGAVSVGERGQIAVPVELRRELDVTPGEKLLIFRLDGEGAAIVLTARGIARLLEGADAEELHRIFSDMAVSTKRANGSATAGGDSE